MEKIKIDESNWSYCYFQLSDLRAQITFGADFVNENESNDLYFVTTMDVDFNDIDQSEHKTLAESIETINQKCAAWQFIDQTKPIAGSSCGTCVAH